MPFTRSFVWLMRPLELFLLLGWIICAVGPLLARTYTHTHTCAPCATERLTCCRHCVRPNRNWELSAVHRDTAIRTLWRRPGTTVSDTDSKPILITATQTGPKTTTTTTQLLHSRLMQNNSEIIFDQFGEDGNGYE